MGVAERLGASTGAATSAGDAIRSPSIAACLFSLYTAKLALKLLGFGRTLRAARSLTTASPHHESTLQEVVDRVAVRVATAAAFLPGRALCLEQSLALYWLLRRRGIAAQLRVGVQPSPFSAHAWIEYHGKPVNEDGDRIKQFLPFPLDAEGDR